MLTSMPATILAPGVEILCSECGSWHEILRSSATNTPFAHHTLYFQCAGTTHYVGQMGEVSHYLTRGGPRHTGIRCRRCGCAIADVEERRVGTLILACPCGSRWSADGPSVR